MDFKLSFLMSVNLKLDYLIKYLNLFDDCLVEKVKRREYDNFVKGFLNKEMFLRDQDIVVNLN